MKLAILALLLMFASSGLATAQNPDFDSNAIITNMGTGNTLLHGLEGCGDITRTLPPKINCFESEFFIAGVLDLLRNLELIKVPSGTTQGEANDIMHLYLKNHPENRHYTAVSLIRKVLQEAWPVPQN